MAWVVRDGPVTGVGKGTGGKHGGKAHMGKGKGSSKKGGHGVTPRSKNSGIYTQPTHKAK